MRIAPSPILRMLAAAACAACGDSESTPSAPAPVATPTVSTPAAGSAVASPLTVEGAAAPGSRVAIALTQNGAEIASASAIVDDGGAWRTTVWFAAADGAFTLSAVAVDDGQRSPSVERALSFDASLAPPGSGLLISRPVAGDTVFGTVDVRGTATSEAAISAIVRQGDMTVGGAAGFASSTGAFSLRVEYESDALSGAALTVEVTQHTEDELSEPVLVNVEHGQTTAVTGTVRDPTGALGTQVYVRAYPVDEDGLRFAAEAMFTTADLTPFGDLDFHLDLPAGDYVLRAFRDGGGPWGGAPDAEPSLGIDAQSPPLAVTVTDSPGAPVALVIDAPAPNPVLPFFDVLTRHESAEPHPPPDADGNGMGLCGGYYLRIETHMASDSPVPRVRLPDGRIVQLLDDGGCGQAGDNTDQSYDHQANDDAYSLGIANPAASLAGDFALAVHDADSGHIGVLVDHLERIQQLSRRVILTAPTGAHAVRDRRPTLSWVPHADAAGYWINIWGPGSVGGAVWVAGTTYTPPQDLENGAVYEVRLDAADAERSQGEDVDAEAFGIANRFVVDETGALSVEIQGQVIRDPTTPEADIGVEAGVDQVSMSTVWVAPQETAFTVTVLKDAGSNGFVDAFVDITGSGEQDGPNRTHTAKMDGIDVSGPAPDVQLSFRPAVDIVAPLEGAVVNDTQPTFIWAPYASPPPSPWSWIVYVSPPDGPEGPPPNIYGLPPTRTRFTLGESTEVADVGQLAHCLLGSGTFDFSRWTCDPVAPTSVTRLMSGSWRWGVGILPCEFGSASYGPCLSEFMSNGPVISSVDVSFVVP